MKKVSSVLFGIEFDSKQYSAGCHFCRIKLDTKNCTSVFWPQIVLVKASCGTVRRPAGSKPTTETTQGIFSRSRRHHREICRRQPPARPPRRARRRPPVISRSKGGLRGGAAAPPLPTADRSVLGGPGGPAPWSNVLKDYFRKSSGRERREVMPPGWALDGLWRGDAGSSAPGMAPPERDWRGDAGST